MNNGYIKLHRQIRDNWIWNNSEKLKAWIDLLLMVTYKERIKFINGEEVKLLPGEVDASIRYLARRWDWSIGKVQRFLKMLQKCKMIDIKTGTGQNIVSICNYATYQIEENKNDTPTGTRAIQERYKNNKYKKDNNIYIDQFEEFWNVYDKKVSKPKAYKSFIQALKKTSFDNLINALKKQKQTWKHKDKAYIKHPTTWLNQECWDDEVIDIKPEVKKRSFLKTPTGLFKAWCSKCGKKLLPNDYQLKQSSECCGVDLVPDDPKVENTSDVDARIVNELFNGGGQIG